MMSGFQAMLGLGLGLLIKLQSLHIQHIPALVEQE